MKLHLLKTAAAALAASGLLTPTILCAQTSETIDSSEAALVVIDGYGWRTTTSISKTAF